MTKKHFEAVAKIINDLPPDGIVRAQLVDRFGAYFASQNPNFDLGRFVDACWEKEYASTKD